VGTRTRACCYGGGSIPLLYRYLKNYETAEQVDLCFVMWESLLLWSIQSVWLCVVPSEYFECVQHDDTHHTYTTHTQSQLITTHIMISAQNTCWFLQKVNFFHMLITYVGTTDTSLLIHSFSPLKKNWLCMIFMHVEWHSQFISGSANSIQCCTLSSLTCVLFYVLWWKWSHWALLAIWCGWS